MCFACSQASQLIQSPLKKAKVLPNLISTDVADSPCTCRLLYHITLADNPNNYCHNLTRRYVILSSTKRVHKSYKPPSVKRVPTDCEEDPAVLQPACGFAVSCECCEDKNMTFKGCTGSLAEYGGGKCSFIEKLNLHFWMYCHASRI